MTIGIVGNSSKESLPQSISSLIDLGTKYHFEYAIHRDLVSLIGRALPGKIPSGYFLSPEELVKRCDVIIAFGGDGTMLAAARIVGNTGIPILGINLGKLGFLAISSREELESFISDIVQKKYTVEERSVLHAVLEGTDEELSALNEVVIDKRTSSRVIRLSVFVNDDYLVTFPGDGIIVSTPTGSTGYALAAGAPIVVPATSGFVIQPISAHSLNARTVIIPDTSVIVVKVEDENDEVRLTADGQIVRNFFPPKKVVIRKNGYTIKLIKRKDRSYYDVLRAKLLWGSDVRIENGEAE